MLEITRLRTDSDQIREALRKRGLHETDLQNIDRALELDRQRRALQTELDENLNQAKQHAKAIGSLYKQGKREEADAAKQEVAKLKDSGKQLQKKLQETERHLDDTLYLLPNAPHDLVPSGTSEEDNEVFQEASELPTLDPDAKPHWEIAEQYGIFDLELGVKITGSGFPVYRPNGAKLQRALINFFLDRAGAAGYQEYQVPHLVNEDTARATGQLPDKEGQMYHAERDDLYLIPTAEVPLTNIYRDVLLKEEELPIKLTGYTPCFRREAGSYGAHVRGLNRVHQFDKVEIVQVVHPDKSYEALDDMLDHVRALLSDLGLPYRILRLCGGDLGFTSALTYDFEVWSAAQQRWLEVSSVSNFETFQSNRLKLRYRDGKKNRLAHTLNGSALALPRIVACILENNQTPEGIRVPEVLRPYLGDRAIIA